MAGFLETWGSDTICSAEVTQALIAANASGEYELPRAKIWIFPTPRPNELLVNATRLVGRDGRELYPADPDDLTEAELVGRRQVREYARFLRDHIPGLGESFVNDTGVQAGISAHCSIGMAPGWRIERVAAMSVGDPQSASSDGQICNQTLNLTSDIPANQIESSFPESSLRAAAP